jgi:pimeloyl-ACP methyl ester carboxylesterase
MLALTAECASISVAENPDEPKGCTIELFVARVPAISLNKKPDPLFLIAGGPGTSSVDLYTSSSGSFERVRRDRDIILVDQRGTGRSHRLDCDYGDQNLFERIDEVEGGPPTVKCRDELTKKSDCAYTTSVAVRDLDRCGIARLRTHQPYGNSTERAGASTRAPLPKATRAVILDGVVNPEVVLGPA